MKIRRKPLNAPQAQTRVATKEAPPSKKLTSLRKKVEATIRGKIHPSIHKFDKKLPQGKTATLANKVVQKIISSKKTQLSQGSLRKGKLY